MCPKKLPVMTPEERKEYYKQYNSNYYQQNKEKMTTQLLEPKFCPYCQKDIAKYRYTRHCKSLKHQQNEINFVDEMLESDDEK